MKTLATYHEIADALERGCPHAHPNICRTCGADILTFIKRLYYDDGTKSDR